MYLLHQKTYINDIFSTVQSNLHNFFLKVSLIFIYVVAIFLYKLNNELPVFMTFAWSLLVM
jgi:hypothetical protein